MKHLMVLDINDNEIKNYFKNIMHQVIRNRDKTVLDINDKEVKNYFKGIMHQVITEHDKFSDQKITSKEVMKRYNIKSHTTMVKYRKEGLPTLTGSPLTYDPREVELWMKNRANEKFKNR